MGITNDFDLQQIYLELGKAKSLLLSSNLDIVKSCNNKQRAMVMIPNTTNEASFNATLCKHNWIKNVVRAMAPNKNDKDAAIQLLIGSLMKQYPKAVSGAAKNWLCLGT